MILEHLLTFVGALLKHIIGVLLLCWRRMLRAALIAFAIGVVVTVLIAVISSGQAVPSAPALIVALLLGLGLAYGVALTVLTEELILGIIDVISMIEGDVSAGAHIAEIVGEREVGEVGQGMRRFFGLPVSKRAPTRPGATLAPLTRVKPQGQPAGASTRSAASPLVEAGVAAAGAALAGAARRAEPATPAAAPDAAPEASGEPVPADRLPRITWTYEHEAVRPPAAPEQTAAPAGEPGAEEPAPIASAPPDASPVETSPAETLPVETSPVETLPVETSPVETSPVETSPASETSASETSALEADYDDERLAAPASVTAPEEPAEPGGRVDDAAREDEPQTTPGAPEPDWGDTAPVAVVSAPPVPAPAPATVPLARDEPGDTQPVEVADAPQEAAPEAPAAEPAGRQDSARRTLPLGDADATLEAPRVGASSGPRPSAPESGLWERLSNALINRAGTPTGPFAPAPPLTSDEPAADEGAREPGTGGEA